METAINPGELIAALSPSRIYWRALSRRMDGLDELVHLMAQSPMFQYTYGSIHGLDTFNVINDLRAATSLMAMSVFSENEIAYFHRRDLLGYVNHGLALAARYLRPRVSNIPVESLLDTIRSTVFSFILKLIGEDLKDPRPVLQEVVSHLDLSDSARMAVLQAALANVKNQSSKITVH